MATHSSVLAWRIPGTGEPSGLPSMGSHRVGHDWSDLVVVVVVVVDVNQPQVYMCPPSLTLLPPPYPSHSSGLSQCTGSECPVSCIELGLVIYFTYGNIHVSVLVSQIIPPSPSPTESKSLFFMSVSLAVSHIGSLLPSFYISYIWINILYWCFSFWLTSLCI